MIALDFARLLGSVAHEWQCPECATPQVAIRPDADLPQDGVCQSCRDRRQPPMSRLAAGARVPVVFLPFLRREYWETYFGLAWPEELASWEEHPSVAYLWGDTGTGKSTAAAILLAERLAAGGRGRWADGLEVRDELLREVRGELASGLMVRLQEAPWLVLDEPLAGRPTPWALAEIYRLVRYRQAAELPTIYTSQLDPKALLATGSRAAARQGLAERSVRGSSSAATTSRSAASPTSPASTSTCRTLAGSPCTSKWLPTGPPGAV